MIRYDSRNNARCDKWRRAAALLVGSSIGSLSVSTVEETQQTESNNNCKYIFLVHTRCLYERFIVLDSANVHNAGMIGGEKKKSVTLHAAGTCIGQCRVDNNKHYYGTEYTEGTARTCTCMRTVRCLLLLLLAHSAEHSCGSGNFRVHTAIIRRSSRRKGGDDRGIGTSTWEVSTYDEENYGTWY